MLPTVQLVTVISITCSSLSDITYDTAIYVPYSVYNYTRYLPYIQVFFKSLTMCINSHVHNYIIVYITITYIRPSSDAELFMSRT